MANQQTLKAMIIATVKSDRHYNYVAVHCVRKQGCPGEGMRHVLDYCEASVEYALDFMRKFHPEMDVLGVTDFVGVAQ